MDPTSGDQARDSKKADMDPTQFLMTQVMELWKQNREIMEELRKKPGSNEDYVMNALAARLPEFIHDPENG
ncbi:unnamed protein product [Cylicocyclus nassatus]|uniref:Uncharacterized protein n=1 Tax=Cylicocyclus nassatus TaxID=53992 RepID=A0AA36MGM2_CYLNA|nr:unnamed protein product [Cylicocyclus nassatus]